MLSVNSIKWSDLPVLTLLSLTLAGGPLNGILYSYSKIVPSIHGISSAQGNIKHFPPVHLTSPLSPCFIVEA